MPKILIYSKTICPYCVKAKNLFKRKNVEFNEIIVDSEEIKNEMIAKSSGRMTVPQIFINEKHIGGCDDLYALDKEGKLDELLAN
jgi:glutaredoxin 3